MTRKVRNFAAYQIKRILQQPLRIFMLPALAIRFVLQNAAVVIMRRAIASMPRQPSPAFLLALSRRWLPASTLSLARRWLPPSTISLVASQYFLIAMGLLDKNQPEAAWRSFRSCLKISSEPSHYFASAICLMVGLGRFQDAMALFTRGNALLLNKAKTLGIADSKLRFLEQFWIAGFGHLAYIDYFIKYEILEGRGRADSVLYIPHGVKIPNKFLLDLWRPYLNVVDDESELPMPFDAISNLSFYFLAPRLADGSTVHLWEIGAETYRRWEDAKHAPLLSLNTEIQLRARQVLARHGVPDDAWFVTLHVREAGSKQHHADLHNVLNSDVRSYFSAIEEVTRRGGWVIRLGDPSMTRLPQHPNVFDYCMSEDRSDWMDIYLCSAARFSIGTSSGPAYVPATFDVPCVHTNWWPPAQRPWHQRDIFIPKLYRRISNRETLTLSQSLREPFGYCNSTTYLRKSKGVEVLDNSADEIRDAVIEMFERTENAAVYSEEDVKLRELADYVYRANNVHGAARLARDFLRQRKTFLE